MNQSVRAEQQQSELKSALLIRARHGSAVPAASCVLRCELRQLAYVLAIEYGRGRPWHRSREIMNGILWIVGTGAQRAGLPPALLRAYPSLTECTPHRAWFGRHHDGASPAPGPRSRAPTACCTLSPRRP